MRDPGILVSPIGCVRSERADLADDFWGGVESTIELDGGIFTPDALLGLDGFSHLEVVYHLHRVDPATVERGARHPRERRDWPFTGILAQRAKARPNRIGVSRCRILGVSGLVIRVEGLDAIDGTPVLDLKPWMTETGPRGDVRQPAWATDLMRSYYRRPREG